MCSEKKKGQACHKITITVHVPIAVTVRFLSVPDTVSLAHAISSCWTVQVGNSTVVLRHVKGCVGLCRCRP
jgi:hypothetical protein